MTANQRRLVSRLTLIAPLVVSLGTANRAAGQAAATAGGTTRTALFTDAQATRGEVVYRQSCASCHGAALTGGSAPSLTGPRFAGSWGDPRISLDDLFFVVSTTMPPRASNTLSAQDHAAVFAHILKTNGYPSGATPLAGGSTQLKQAHLDIPGVPRPAARAPTPAFIPGTPGAAPANSGPDQATLNAAARSTDWLFHGHESSAGPAGVSQTG